MNSTPRTPASTMRFTAFVPPPPTPTTLMTAKCSEPGMFGISSSTPVAFYCCVCLVSARRCSGATCGPPKGGIYAGHCTRCPFVCNANHRQRSLQIHEYDKKPTASRFAGRQSGQPRRASQGSEASDRIVFSLPGSFYICKTPGREHSLRGFQKVPHPLDAYNSRFAAKTGVFADRRPRHLLGRRGWEGRPRSPPTGKIAHGFARGSQGEANRCLSGAQRRQGRSSRRASETS